MGVGYKIELLGLVRDDKSSIKSMKLSVKLDMKLHPNKD